jgi:hypothetical protein
VGNRPDPGIDQKEIEMTDLPEKKSATTDEGADFEGQKLSSPERKSDTVDRKSLVDEDGPDFEGHRLAGPERKADISNKKA